MARRLGFLQRENALPLQVEHLFPAFPFGPRLFDQTPGFAAYETVAGEDLRFL